jgi:phosphonate transport system permease protein
MKTPNRNLCFAKATGLNALFVYVFLFSLKSLHTISTNFNYELLADGQTLGIFAPISLVAGLLWSLSRFSPGYLCVFRTHTYFKNLEPEISVRKWIGSFSGLFSSLIFVAFFALGWTITEVRIDEFFSAEGVSGAKRIFLALLSPDTSILVQALEMMIVTIFTALLATVFSVPLAFVLSFLMARNLTKGSMGLNFCFNFLKLLTNIMRSIEPVVWAVIFSVWVNVGPFAGMLALMVHSVASLVKLYSEQIEHIDNGPLEAIQTVGANKLQVIWYAVVPQIILPFFSHTIFRWDINIRMATIIGLVGGGGIGTLLNQATGLAQWSKVGMIIVIITFVVWTMDYVSSKIREAIA